MLYDVIEETFHKWWNDVCIRVNNAVVFLDAAAAESLHWNGGLLRILKAGAKTVKAFSPFERGEEAEQKVLFIITTPLFEEELHVLQVILQASSFMYCTVITSVPEYIYSQGRQNNAEKEDRYFFNSVEEKLLNHMGNMSYTSEIVYIPIFGMNICTNFFLMPVFWNIFPSVNPDSAENAEYVSERKLKGSITENSTLLQREIELKILAHSLNVLFEQMNIREDIFSLGQLSHVLGWELDSLTSSRNRKKLTSKKMSLLLIDRTLDLAGPLSQNCHSVLDRIIRVLPHLPGHLCDVAVDMSSLCASRGGNVFGMSLVAPGCLGGNDQFKKTLLNSFVSKKQKDCLMSVNRLLVDKSIQKGLCAEPSNLMRRITPEQILKQVTAYRGNLQAVKDNLGILEYALAICQTLQDPTNKILDEVQGTEQLLLQNLATSAQDAFRNLLYLISKQKERSLSLSIIMALISYFYALDDGSILTCKENEQKLQAALVEAIFQDSDELPSFLKNLIGDVIDENSVITAVNKIFRQLKFLSKTRKNKKQYKSVFDPGDTIHPAIYVPILKKLFEDIFNSSIVDYPDIEFHSAGFTDILKSSFSIFMNVTKPKPRDNPVIMVIVLGGITATEVHQIKEIAEKFSKEVIIGSTMLVTPNDITEKIFKVSDS